MKCIFWHFSLENDSPEEYQIKLRNSAPGRFFVWWRSLKIFSSSFMEAVRDVRWMTQYWQWSSALGRQPSHTNHNNGKSNIICNWCMFVYSVSRCILFTRKECRWVSAAARAILTPIWCSLMQKKVIVTAPKKQRVLLRFLWLEKNIGIALDQVVPGHGTIPLSPYYFWPRKDAWEQLKAKLDSKGWISRKRTIILLNQATDIINLWQQNAAGL